MMMMMMIIIIITIIHYSPCCCLYLLIARHFFTATSLKCYKCNSETSWHQCEKHRETVTCPEEHEEVCSKVLYDHELHSRQTYTKFCDMKSQCTNTTQPICKAAETHNAQCEVHCCTHDLCNAGSATAVSGILQIACAVLLLMFLSVEEAFNPWRHQNREVDGGSVWKLLQFSRTFHIFLVTWLIKY